MNFSSEEYLSISNDLEIHHAIFNRLWALGKPTFDEKIPTAAVFFDKVGETLDFKINPIFWSTLSSTQKLFVICHECLHVILNHGRRISSCASLALANQALDIVVNHALIERFGFQRSEVDPDNKYCWVDTVFQGAEVIPPADKYFEYYYNLLLKQFPDAINANAVVTVDAHGEMGDFSDLIDKLNQELDPEVKEGFKDLVEREKKESPEEGSQGRGAQGGTQWKFVKIEKVVRKKKWETVITRWSLKYLKEREEEQWARTHRRMYGMDHSFFLPAEYEVEEGEKDRIQVYFFQDTSGSCVHLAERFFKAAATLSPEKFDVKLHCFDTRVYETSLATGKLYGFGGTTFTCIERYIQSQLSAGKISKYPPAVFVVTDGLGDYVKPQLPKNWYWFLSYNYTHCIPNECKTFMLKDFE